MGMMELMATRVAAGATVEFRPTGSSMVPLIRSRQLVTVAPVDTIQGQGGDIVLAKVTHGLPAPGFCVVRGPSADQQQPRAGQRLDEPRTRLRHLYGRRRPISPTPRGQGAQRPTAPPNTH